MGVLVSFFLILIGNKKQTMKFYKEPLRFYRDCKLYGLRDAISIYKLSNRKNSDVLKIKGSVNGQSKDLLLRNNTTDFSIFRQIFISKDYDLNFIFEPETIIDAGAYTGLSTVFFALKYPKCKIISIEPDSDNYLLLEKNVKNLTNVISLNKALWSESTNLTIIKPDNYHKDSISVIENYTDSNNVIKSVCIADLIKTHDLKKIDILKMDIEGAEFNVFSRNYHWIDLVRVIIIELHDYNKEGASSAFFKVISNLGFSVLLRGENLICFRSYSEYLGTIKNR